MKTNLIKKVMAMIVLVSLSFMFKSFHCPPSQEPVCPVPDPVYTMFFPHPYDCHYFFYCHNGLAYCQKCPAGLQWNRELEVCDYPNHAECSNSGGTSSLPNVGYSFKDSAEKLPDGRSIERRECFRSGIHNSCTPYCYINPGYIMC